MLNHEQAQKRLKPYHVKNWEKARLAAVGALPGEAKKVGQALLGRDAAGKPFTNWQKRHKAMNEAGTAIQKMSPAARTRLFAALFPKLAPYIERGWQLFARLPYEVDYDRKGFRATDDSEVHREARWSWLTNLVHTFQGYDPDIAWAAAWAPHLAGGYHAQEIGLLFADDDSRTAEVVSKVLLLARDHEILDPSILEQLKS
ncbi:MAG: hypothetical protein U0797_01725 [Gemmataceae bacterium]